MLQRAPPRQMQASRWKLTAASTGRLTAFLETPRSGRFEIRRGSQQGWNRGNVPKRVFRGNRFHSEVSRVRRAAQRKGRLQTADLYRRTKRQKHQVCYTLLSGDLSRRTTM